MIVKYEFKYKKLVYFIKINSSPKLINYEHLPMRPLRGVKENVLKKGAVRNGAFYFQHQNINHSMCLDKTKQQETSQNWLKTHTINMRFEHATTQKQNKIQQKQRIIDHLHLELQQSKYIIQTLKKNIKQSQPAQTIHENPTNIGKKNQKTQSNPQFLQLKLQNQSLRQEIQFLKQKDKQDKSFFGFYEALIQKLTLKIQKLQQQKPIAQPTQQKVQNYHKRQVQISSKTTNAQNIQKKTVLGENINISNLSSDKNLIVSSQNDSRFSISKQNHPSTPKNAYPVSLKKASDSREFIDSQFQKLSVCDRPDKMQPNKQNHRLVKYPYQMIKNSTVVNNKRSNQSPYKLKERLINNRNRSLSIDLKPSQVQQELLLESSYKMKNLTSQKQNERPHQQKRPNQQKYTFQQKKTKPKNSINIGLNMNFNDFGTQFLNDKMKLDRKIYF